MAEVSSMKAGYPGLICPKFGVVQPKFLPLQIPVFKWSRFKGCKGIQAASGMIATGKIQYCRRKRYPLYVGRNPHYHSSNDDFTPVPFWSNLLKEAFRVVKSLIDFLVEQPSQLKYIEWPSLQSTLKTATLTLLLVGLLIVAVSSVDSALYYILAILLRRRA